MLIRPITIEINSGQVNGFEELKTLLDLKYQMEIELANALALQISLSADAKLNSTKKLYIDSLSVEGSSVVLDTSNFVVHMIEEGNKPFDMKDALLRSPKAKIGKNGQKYIVVPISKYKSGRYNWRDRNSGQFSKGTNDGDVEFRVVSEHSDPDIFIHPGHIGFNFVDRAIETFEMNSIIDKYLDKII